MWSSSDDFASSNKSDKDSLVEEVKEMQRSDPVAKEQWWAYADSQGDGVRDPMRHDVPFLQNFIDSFYSGARLETASDNGGIGELFKEGQRKSAGFKQAWAAYCNVFGDGKSDPLKKDLKFLTGFLDHMGQRGAMVLSAHLGGMGMGMDGGDRRMGGRPGAKRMRTESAKDGLVNRIKAFQKSGEEQKQLWWDHCDSELGGVRDPNRHDMTTLEDFVVNYEVP